MTLDDLSADRVLLVLGDAAVRGLLLLALAGLATALMRRASAAARHWVWLLGLVGMMVLPVLSAVLPAWRVLPRVMAQPQPDAVEVLAPPEFPAAALPVAAAAPAGPGRGGGIGT